MPNRPAPSGRRELDAYIREIAGSGGEFTRVKEEVAAVVLSKMLPESVLKGGTAVELRYGRSMARYTTDIDVATISWTSFEDRLYDDLQQGWAGFTCRASQIEQHTPVGVQRQYAMRPYTVEMSYLGLPWSTMVLEVGYNEIGDAENPEMVSPEEVEALFEELGLPNPCPLRFMSVEHQIAQKLHAVSAEKSERAHDLIDLQILSSNETLRLERVKQVCKRLFTYRKQQSWPPALGMKDNWEQLYSGQAYGLDVAPDVKDAIDWANDFIQRIDESDE